MDFTEVPKFFGMVTVLKLSLPPNKYLPILDASVIKCGKSKFVILPPTTFDTANAQSPNLATCESPKFTVERFKQS